MSLLNEVLVIKFLSEDLGFVQERGERDREREREGERERRREREREREGEGEREGGRGRECVHELIIERDRG